MRAVDAFALSLRDDLLAGAIHGGLLVLAVWLACRGPELLRLRGIPAVRVPPAVQVWLWWLAAARLIVALLPIPGVPLPVLPADTVAVPAAMATFEPAASGAFAPRPEGPPARLVPRSAAPVSWATGLVGLWAIAVALHAARLGAAYVRLRRVVRESTPASEESRRLAARVAARIGMTRVPEVRTAVGVSTPQALGIWRPLILLPVDSDAALPSSERAMVLAHELMHVRRCDVVLGWVPAIAERLFFFHPLARLAAREYLVAREAACDAGAIDALGIDAARYGALLVAIGVHRPVPSFAASGGAWSSSSLKRRLEMLQHARRQRLSTFARWSFAAAACACLVPFQLVARATVAGPAQSIDSSSIQAAAPAVRVQAPGQSAVQVPEPPAPPASPAARPVVPAPPASPASPDARPVVPAPPAPLAQPQASDNPQDVADEIHVLLSSIAELSRRANGETQAEVLALLQRLDEMVSSGYRQQLEQALETLQSQTGRRAVSEQLVAEARRFNAGSRAERAARIEALDSVLPAQAAARARQDAEQVLRVEAEKLLEAQRTLEEQLEQVRRTQEQLREDQRLLQQALERLAGRLEAETKK